MQILNDDVKIMHDGLMKDRSEGNMSLSSLEYLYYVIEYLEYI